MKKPKDHYFRVLGALTEEDGLEEVTLWMSFADPGRPVGQRFLGVIIIDAPGLATATTMTHTMGINPGGEIQSMEIPEDLEIKPFWKNRLLTKAECEMVDDILLKQIEEQKRAKP
jgi:hypothetical protein